MLGWWGAALVLWRLGLVLWAVVIYTTLIAVVVRGEKPGIGLGINGSWFLLTVSAESICVLGALLLARVGGEALASACLGFFSLGIVLYLIVVTLVFLRWTFARQEAAAEEPRTWIAFGAVAIIVLAGSNPSYWSLGFPLGMYAVSTFRRRLALDLGPLAALPAGAPGGALLAWVVTSVRLARHSRRLLCHAVATHRGAPAT